MRRVTRLLMLALACSLPFSASAGERTEGPRSVWVGVEMLDGAQVAEELARELRTFAPLRDTDAARERVAAWEREIREERDRANGDFLKLSFAMRRRHATELASRTAAALHLLRLKDEILETRAMVDILEKDRARHVAARAQVAAKRLKAEEGFPLVYSNFHTFFVAGAVARCRTGDNTITSVGLERAMRDAANGLVHESGAAFYVRVTKELRKELGVLGQPGREHFIEEVRVDRSLSLSPLGEPIDRPFQMDSGSAIRVDDMLRVVIYPVSAQPRVAANPRSRPPGDGAARTGPATPEACTIHPFLLSAPGEAERALCPPDPATPESERLPEWVCAQPDVAGLLGSAGDESSRLAQMLASVTAYDDPAMRRQWQEEVARYSDAIDDLRAREERRRELAEQAKAESERLAGQVVVLEKEYAGACARESAKTAAPPAESLFPKRKVIVTVEYEWPFEHDGDTEARRRDALAMVERARSKASGDHRDWLQEYLRDEEGSQYVLTERTTLGVPARVTRFRIVDMRLVGETTQNMRKAVKVAFELGIEVPRELLLPFDDIPQRDADVDGLFRFKRTGRLVYVMPGDEVGFRRAGQALAKIREQRLGGASDWRLVRRGELRALRVVCHALSDAASAHRGCACAWTDTQIRDQDGSGLGSRLLEVLEPRSPAGIGRLVEDTSCGVVLATGDVSESAPQTRCELPGGSGP